MTIKESTHRGLWAFRLDLDVEGKWRVSGWNDAKFRLIRDLLIFTLGLSGAVFEIFFTHGPRDTGVMVLIAGALGLPAFLKASQSGKGSDD